MFRGSFFISFSAFEILILINHTQEVTANFNDYSEYANYIGLNSACKMRWTGQWPQNVNEVQPTSGKATINEEQLDQQQIMSIEHQLHQQLQQQFCVEQFQLLSQLQVRLISCLFFFVNP